MISFYSERQASKRPANAKSTRVKEAYNHGLFKTS